MSYDDAMRPDDDDDAMLLFDKTLCREPMPRERER